MTNRRRLLDTLDELVNTTPPHISTKGNSFALVDSTNVSKPITTQWLDCVLIDVNEKGGRQRVFWGLDQSGQPKQYDEQKLPPLCFSDNGIGASTRAQEPQSTSCNQCPMAEFNWPSRVNPNVRTPACKSLLKVAVMVFKKGERDGQTYSGELAADFPFLLRIPFTSFANLHKYRERFRGHDELDPSDVVTRITFVQGSVGELQFEPYAFMNDDDKAEIHGIMDKDLTDNLVGRNDVSIQALPASKQDPLVSQQAKRTETKPAPKLVQPAGLLDAPASSAPRKRGRPAKVDQGLNTQQQQAPFTTAPQQITQAPFASNGPTHGIITDAAAPPGEVERALDSLFNVTTK